MIIKCDACDTIWDNNEIGYPWLEFKKIKLCCPCYTNIISQIYNMAGYGDGGLIHLIFQLCLNSAFNKKRRKSLKASRKLFKDLLYKFKFSCIKCGCKDEKKLSVDHIIPFSKGGLDDFENLQILCKLCNSKKGVK